MRYIVKMVAAVAILVILQMVFTAHVGLAQGDPELPPNGNGNGHENGNDNGRDNGDDDDKIAHIELHSGYHGVNTVVQWLDGQGQWQDVEGWRTFSQDGMVRWTVEERHFGTGPYRWIVYQPRGRAAATSQGFFLPYQGETTKVAVYEPVYINPPEYYGPRSNDGYHDRQYDDYHDRQYDSYHNQQYDSYHNQQYKYQRRGPRQYYDPHRQYQGRPRYRQSW